MQCLRPPCLASLLAALGRGAKTHIAPPPPKAVRNVKSSSKQVCAVPPEAGTHHQVNLIVPPPYPLTVYTILHTHTHTHVPPTCIGSCGRSKRACSRAAGRGLPGRMTGRKLKKVGCGDGCVHLAGWCVPCVDDEGPWRQADYGRRRRLPSSRSSAGQEGQLGAVPDPDAGCAQAAAAPVGVQVTAHRRPLCSARVAGAGGSCPTSVARLYSLRRACHCPLPPGGCASSRGYTRVSRRKSLMAPARPTTTSRTSTGSPTSRCSTPSGEPAAAAARRGLRGATAAGVRLCARVPGLRPHPHLLPPSLSVCPSAGTSSRTPRRCAGRGPSTTPSWRASCRPCRPRTGWTTSSRRGARMA